MRRGGGGGGGREREREKRGDKSGDKKRKKLGKAVVWTIEYLWAHSAATPPRFVSCYYEPRVETQANQGVVFQNIVSIDPSNNGIHCEIKMPMCLPILLILSHSHTFRGRVLLSSYMCQNNQASQSLLHCMMIKRDDHYQSIDCICVLFLVVILHKL